MTNRIRAKRIIGSTVLYKSADELPTYHLANIVDDHLMVVSHVIREMCIRDRYKDIRLPHIELVDIKELAHQKRMQGPFSPALVKQIKEALECKEQVILLSLIHI